MQENNQINDENFIVTIEKFCQRFRGVTRSIKIIGIILILACTCAFGIGIFSGIKDIPRLIFGATYEANKIDVEYILYKRYGEEFELKSTVANMYDATYYLCLKSNEKIEIIAKCPLYDNEGNRCKVEVTDNYLEVLELYNQQQ